MFCYNVEKLLVDVFWELVKSWGERATPLDSTVKSALVFHTIHNIDMKTLKTNKEI